MPRHASRQSNHAQHQKNHAKDRQHHSRSSQGYSSAEVESDAPMEGIESFQQETADFIQRRMGHTAETLKRYQECRSVVEMLAVQQQWFLETAHDYVETGLKLAQTMAGAASNSAAQMGLVIEAEADEITDTVRHASDFSARAAGRAAEEHPYG